MGGEDIMEDKEKKISEIFSLQCKVIPLPSDNQESQPSNSNNEHSEGSNGTEEDGHITMVRIA